MTQHTETMTPTNATTNLAGILAALKGSGFTSGVAASGGTFSSLLTEMNGAAQKMAEKPEATVQDDSLSQTAGSVWEEQKNKGSAKAETALADVKDDVKDQRRAQEKDRINSSQEDGRQEPQSAQEDQAPTAQDSSAVDKTREENEDLSACAQETDVAVTQDDAQEDSQKAVETDADGLEELFASFMPMIAPEASKQTAMTAVPVSFEPNVAAQSGTDPLQESLDKMQALQAQMLAEGQQETAQSQQQASQDFSEQLDKVAQNLSELQDDFVLAASDKKTLSSLTQAAMPETQDQGTYQAVGQTDGLKTLLGRGAFENAANQNNTNGAGRDAQMQALLAQQNAQTNNAALVAGGSSASSGGLAALDGAGGASAAAHANNQGAMQNLVVSDGLKTVGSYDFASQLSALRATKGGAANLPQAVEQVAVQLNKAAKNGAEEITINLKPADLGRIEIKLEFAADKTVTGTVTADNQQTLNMLQKDSQTLQRALQDAGLQADSGSLSFNLRGDQNQNQFAQGQNASSSYEASASSFSEEKAPIEALAAQVEYYYLTPGSVNIHV